MAILSETIKADIVIQLAQYRGYSEIARDIQTGHGVEVDRFQIRSYDLTKPTYAAGERWRVLFERTRSSYLSEVDQIPIAHKAYRLNELQRLYDRARNAGNIVLAGALLGQAAKEAGGVFTNGRSMPLSSPLIMTPEERHVRLMNLFGRAFEQTTLNDPGRE
jgi:hypothetical protein